MKHVSTKRLTGLAEKNEELGKTSSVIKQVGINKLKHVSTKSSNWS